MKKVLFLFALIVSTAVFAQSPAYTTVRLQDDLIEVVWQASDTVDQYIVIGGQGNVLDTVQNTSNEVIKWIDSNAVVDEVNTYSLRSITNGVMSTDLTYDSKNIVLDMQIDGDDMILSWNPPTMNVTWNNYLLYLYDDNDELTVQWIISMSETSITIPNAADGGRYMIGIERTEVDPDTVANGTIYEILSNKVVFDVLSIDENETETQDEIVGFYDLNGRKLKGSETGIVMVTVYKSGMTKKTFKH